MNCKSNKPYPEIKVEKKSKQIANILSHIYASNESELTVILQYSYQTFILEEEKIKKILKDIAEVEMHHLKILGELIYKLGQMPMYIDSKYCKENYWNADYVYYDMDLKTILDVNIASEKTNIRNYQLALTVIEDKYIENILKRILEDEYIHLEIFMKLRQNLNC